jgi:hypothetical protein
MYPGEKPATGRLAAAGRTALLAGLAVLFVVGGSEVVPLETGYYDLLQRLAATPAMPAVPPSTGATPSHR